MKINKLRINKIFKFEILLKKKYRGLSSINSYYHYIIDIKYHILLDTTHTHTHINDNEYVSKQLCVCVILFFYKTLLVLYTRATLWKQRHCCRHRVSAPNSILLFTKIITLANNSQTRAAYLYL